MKSKQEKGITLIALVVTIVVLLILAGVTITLVLGEDGIIAQAKLAAERVKEEEENAEKDLNKLAGDIQNWVNGGTGETESGDVTPPANPSSSPETPTPPTPTQNVSQELTDDEKDQITIGTAEATEYYGKVVKVKGSSTDEYYTAGGINKWRLFYQDSNYTYIISNDLVTTQNQSLETLYTNAEYGSTKGNEVSPIGQKLNSQFKNFTSDNGNKNIKAVAYLTDPKNWEEYKAGNAVYAIGSPTAELFAASYNATKNGYTIELMESDMGYSANTSRGWLPTTRGGIYNTGRSVNWWLASPGTGLAVGGVGVFSVGESNSLLGCGNVTGTLAVRPLVCFRKSDFESKYTLVDG